MSYTPTFRLGDLVWIAETVNNGQDFALRQGIVKEIDRNGLLITVDWMATEGLEYVTTAHIANNLAYTADEAIQKFIAWATSVLTSHKHAYEREAAEKQAKILANDTAPAVVLYGLNDEQFAQLIDSLKVDKEKSDGTKQ